MRSERKRVWTWAGVAGRIGRGPEGLQSPSKSLLGGVIKTLLVNRPPLCAPTLTGTLSR